MQLTTWLAEAVKSGKVTVYQNDVEALQVKAQDKKIDINAEDKNFVKEVISGVREGAAKNGSKKGERRNPSAIRVALEARPLLKEIAEDLCREGVTVTVSYKGDKVVTLGSDANSKLTRLLTGTRGIEVNSPAKLVEMGI